MDAEKVMERLARNEEGLKSLQDRVDKMEALAKSVYAIAEQVKYMREDINDTIDRVVEIEKMPKKRYETVITTIITGVIGGVIGYFIKSILTGGF